MLDAQGFRRFVVGLPGLVAGSVLVGGGLVAVAWFDYRATQRELLGLLGAQATALSQSVAAAARTSHAAGLEAERELALRLLGNARLLREIDRREALTADSLARFFEQNDVFRVTVFSPEGARVLSTGAPGPGAGGGAPWAGAGRGRGAGRPPWAGGDQSREPGGAPRRPPWAGGSEGGGQGGGFAALTERLLTGEVDEAVSDLHAGRWPGQSRLIAGVRRTNGGAILVNVDAAEVATLQTATSIDALLGGIAASAAEIAYVALQRSGDVLVQGTPPDKPLAAADGSEDGRMRTTAGGRPVLDVATPVALDAGADAVLHVGMWLDGLASAERRTWSRLAISLTGALVLGGLALGLVWMRRAYGVLSRRHALAEQALRRRDRLAAMGELASTVAHEVRNPLNAIAMSAQRLQREHFRSPPDDAGSEDAEARELLGVIHHESRRLNGTIEQFLTYARPPRLARSPTSLGDLVARATDALRAAALTRGVTFDVDTREAATADVDAAQLAQVVDNLLRNALDATPSGGRIDVRAQSSADRHEIVVSDTGSGIPPADLPRIFDLYFTTKTDGTGVGLAISQQIVGAHGGTIEVDSEPGTGTSMRIVVPARQGEDDA